MLAKLVWLSCCQVVLNGWLVAGLGVQGYDIGFVVGLLALPIQCALPLPHFLDAPDGDVGAGFVVRNNLLSVNLAAVIDGRLRPLEIDALLVLLIDFRYLLSVFR